MCSNFQSFHVYYYTCSLDLGAWIPRLCPPSFPSLPPLPFNSPLQQLTTNLRAKEHSSTELLNWAILQKDQPIHLFPLAAQLTATPPTLVPPSSYPPFPIKTHSRVLFLLLLALLFIASVCVPYHHSPVLHPIDPLCSTWFYKPLPNAPCSTINFYITTFNFFTLAVSAFCSLQIHDKHATVTP